MIFVTGGAGFIGSNFIRMWIEKTNEPVLNIDKLTYAGNIKNLSDLETNPRYQFVRMDINEEQGVAELFDKHRPRAILNFAAESHVDRSILGPGEFVRTNIQGTFNLLQQSLKYWRQLDESGKKNFRFLHVSTDEVYGSLGPKDAPFSEKTPYAPNSPYSASKAASDHLVRAYFHTYGMPTLTTNCSNNYGPYQFPEKLIPLIIQNALAGKDLPIYGDGSNIRDWLHVQDHCEAIAKVLEGGRVGEVYNIGGLNEIKNIDVVNTICEILDKVSPKEKGSYKDQKKFVKDRPGHDQRYAIDATKINSELGWQPRMKFEQGLEATVQWYLNSTDWVQDILSGNYREWIDKNYGDRT